MHFHSNRSQMLVYSTKLTLVDSLYFLKEATSLWCSQSFLHCNFWEVFYLLGDFSCTQIKSSSTFFFFFGGGEYVLCEHDDTYYNDERPLQVILIRNTTNKCLKTAKTMKDIVCLTEFSVKWLNTELFWVSSRLTDVHVIVHNIALIITLWATDLPSTPWLCACAPYNSYLHAIPTKQFEANSQRYTSKWPVRVIRKNSHPCIFKKVIYCVCHLD